ncbi:LysR family transcriptional regulator [Novosphingobium lentum]|uniref:LysR family transcriptional regulator n=1 Tax=Novosphingobium lentum TaxID=145287 RepID=UPI00082F9365|nr:LysR family transcriptional regulator [Novosphingobium lentum]
MNWSDLQDFLMIARSGQLSRAAALAGVDATTMGRRLRRLEARLGQTLFEQTREGQVLTEAGEAMLAQVEAMDQAAGRIAESTREGSGPTGTLRISVSEGFGTWIVAANVRDFMARHPRLVLDLVANSGFLSPSKREADLAVTLSRPRAGPVIAGKLSDYALRLYASADYLAAHGMPERPADLAHGHPLVGYIPDMVYAPELRYLAEIHPGLVASLRSSSINAQHRLIAAGAGIGVLPCFIGDADAGLVPVLPERRILRSFWLVTHKDTHQLARVRAFKDWLTGLVARERGRLLPG